MNGMDVQIKDNLIKVRQRLALLRNLPNTGTVELDEEETAGFAWELDTCIAGINEALGKISI